MSLSATNGASSSPSSPTIRSGRGSCGGCGLIHTHLKGEPLSEDDLTDLAMLRLDLIAALQLAPAPCSPCHPDRLPRSVPRCQDPLQGGAPCPLGRFRLDFAAFVESLEESLEKGVKTGQEVQGGEERGILISVTDLAAGGGGGFHRRAEGTGPHRRGRGARYGDPAAAPVQPALPDGGREDAGGGDPRAPPRGHPARLRPGADSRPRSVPSRP